jgi:hypothetical protein
MAKVLERMGCDSVTVHGFRSSFRDWAAEQTAFASEVIEKVLAHTSATKWKPHTVAAICWKSVGYCCALGRAISRNLHRLRQTSFRSEQSRT